MKIAQIAPCWLTVPPHGYGGTELVVAHLANGLVDRGHDVTLFASGGSVTKAKLVSYYDEPPGTIAIVANPFADLPHVLQAYSHAGEFDLIHDHTSPLGISIGAHISQPPVVHTLHGPPFAPDAKPIYELIGKQLHVVAISQYQRAGMPELNYAGVVYNGIDLNDYPFRKEKEDYLLFLGRMSPQKGAHLAIDAATRLGRRLIIATKIAEPVEEEYFEKEVKPVLTDKVEMLGEISVEEKADLYSRATCTLMPIQWPEPFGLVMTESMACGTPVAAYRNGSVPEIIEDGVSGFIVEDQDGLMRAIERVGEIDPAACRARVEALFSTTAMLDGYESVYQKVLSS